MNFFSVLGVPFGVVVPFEPSYDAGANCEISFTHPHRWFGTLFFSVKLLQNPSFENSTALSFAFLVKHVPWWTVVFLCAAPNARSTEHFSIGNCEVISCWYCKLSLTTKESNQTFGCGVCYIIQACMAVDANDRRGRYGEESEWERAYDKIRTRRTGIVVLHVCVRVYVCVDDGHTVFHLFCIE